jgi:hypothetical protein
MPSPSVAVGGDPAAAMGKDKETMKLQRGMPLSTSFLTLVLFLLLLLLLL